MPNPRKAGLLRAKFKFKLKTFELVTSVSRSLINVTSYTCTWGLLTWSTWLPANIPILPAEKKTELS